MSELYTCEREYAWCSNDACPPVLLLACAPLARSPTIQVHRGAAACGSAACVRKIGTGCAFAERTGAGLAEMCLTCMKRMWTGAVHTDIPIRNVVDGLTNTTGRPAN